MLKKIEFGMIFVLLSTLCMLSLDTDGRTHNSDITVCFLSNDLLNITALNMGSHFLVIPSSLNAIGYMLFYIAVYEFICSQSPHAMKGLVIGIFFAIKGVFKLLGILVILLPFCKLWKVPVSFPTCSTFCLLSYQCHHSPHWDSGLHMCCSAVPVSRER